MSFRSYSRRDLFCNKNQVKRTHGTKMAGVPILVIPPVYRGIYMHIAYLFAYINTVYLYTGAYIYLYSPGTGFPPPGSRAHRKSF